MNVEERDKLLIEMNGNMKVVAEKVSNHDNTLYGNGQPGLVKDVVLLKANTSTMGSKKTTVAIITGVVASIGLLINFIFELVKWQHLSQ